MLSAYQAWEDARSVDETAEMQFCESRQLNMSTLRMTSEAQVRLGLGFRLALGLRFR